MQQPQQMLSTMPSFPPTNITTEQIQKYLDENKKLIMAILDNQNLGKLAECAQYQAQLQKNLMYLAAIADAQPPQATNIPPQIPPHPAMQQGGHYMQYPQAAMAQPPGVFAPRAPLQFNPQMQEQQQQQQLQLHQQSMQGHMGMRPGANNGMLAMHNETTLGGGSGGSQPSAVGLREFTRGGGGNSGAGASSGSLDVRGGSKHDVSETGSGDGQGNSAAGHGSADGDPSYLKGTEDGN